MSDLFKYYSELRKKNVLLKTMKNCAETKDLDLVSYENYLQNQKELFLYPYPQMLGIRNNRQFNLNVKILQPSNFVEVMWRSR